MTKLLILLYNPNFKADVTAVEGLLSPPILVGVAAALDAPPTPEEIPIFDVPIVFLASLEEFRLFKPLLIFLFAPLPLPDDLVSTAAPGLPGAGV